LSACLLNTAVSSNALYRHTSANVNRRSTMKGRTTIIGLKMLADSLIASSALGLSLLLRLWGEMFQKGSLTIEMVHEYLRYWYIDAPLLIIAILATFSWFRIYTRARLYTYRHKTLLLLQAISVAYCVFV